MVTTKNIVLPNHFLLKRWPLILLKVQGEKRMEVGNDLLIAKKKTPLDQGRSIAIQMMSEFGK